MELLKKYQGLSDSWSQFFCTRAGLALFLVLATTVFVSGCGGLLGLHFAQLTLLAVIGMSVAILFATLFLIDLRPALESIFCVPLHRFYCVPASRPALLRAEALYPASGRPPRFTPRA